jgi:hypothetical protein
MFFHNRLQRVLALFALALFLFVLPARLSAQWTPGAGGLIYYTGGNVAIGASSSSAPLLVADNDSNFLKTLVLENANTGVDAQAGIEMVQGSNIAYVFQQGGGFWLYNTAANGYIEFNINGTNELTMTANGYVGIGTASPQHLLHVAGTIGAEEVIVSATGADYVFDPNYRLAPLREVAAYVEANRHLPGIPSAEEMRREGVSVGDMQMKLLASVEELTLQMIELEKQNLGLKERLAHLEDSTASKQH